MLERRFVLVPLLEAWPEAVLPDGAVPSFQGPESSGQDVVRLTVPLSVR